MSSQLLGCECGSARQGRTASHDTVGSQHALAEISNVHRASLAVAKAGSLSIDLRHHAMNITSFRQAVAVSAMRAGDLVAIVEVHANSRRHSLLAGIEMHKSRNLAGRELEMDSLFELPDQFHGSVGFE